MISKFIFPPEPSLFQTIASSDHLQKLLIDEAQSSEISVRYIIRKIRRYIYATCSRCPCQIRYVKNQQEGFYLMRKITLNHCHKAKISKTQILVEAIQNLPFDISARAAKRILDKHYNYSISTYYRAFHRSINPSLQIYDLQNSLKNPTLISYISQDQNSDSCPNLLILSSDEMKMNFFKFGDVLTFDFTYNLIFGKSRQNNYSVGTMVGYSNSAKIVPFGFVITTSETKETIAKILYQFFKMMGKAPDTILTDEQGSIEAGLKLLTYEGEWDGLHIFDSYHILNNIRKKLHAKDNLKYFKNLLRARNAQQFQKIWENSQSFLQAQSQEILRSFYEKRFKTCFGLLPEMFIGITTSSSIVEKFNDLIKIRIPMSKPYKIVLEKLIRLCEDLTRKSEDVQMQKLKVQEFVSDSFTKQLAQIKRNCSKRIFRIASKNLFSSVFCLMKIIQDEAIYQVHDENGSFLVQNCLENERLSCDCGYYNKSGLFCSHIAKIALILGKNLNDYIFQRWKVQLLRNRQAIKSYSRKTRANKTRY